MRRFEIFWSDLDDIVDQKKLHDMSYRYENCIINIDSIDITSDKMQ